MASSIRFSSGASLPSLYSFYDYKYDMNTYDLRSQSKGTIYCYYYGSSVRLLLATRKLVNETFEMSELHEMNGNPLPHSPNLHVM